MPFFSSAAQYSHSLSGGTGVPPSPPIAVVTPSISLFSARPFFGSTAIGGEGGTPVPPDKLREYWAAHEKNGISLNFGTYFSETQAREAVLNYDARKPNE